MATSFTPATPDEREPPDTREGKSTVSLIRRLMDEASMLFRQEIALATKEVSNALILFVSGLSSVAAGAAVLFAGLLLLLTAAVLGLSMVMRPWLAALLVGAVVCIVGYVLVHRGRKSLKPADLIPSRSPDSLRQDKDLLMRKR